MVCLNENISFKKLVLRDNLNKEIIQAIRLNSELDLDENIFKKIKNIIHYKFKELFSNNYFLYINMDDNVCSHMFKRGKKEGHFCHKKITSNGNRENYVCTIHNKNHKPQKKNKNHIKNIKNHNGENNCNIISKGNVDSISKNISKRNNKKINKNRLRRKKFKKIVIRGFIDFKYIYNNFLI